MSRVDLHRAEIRAIAGDRYVFAALRREGRKVQANAQARAPIGFGSHGKPAGYLRSRIVMQTVKKSTYPYVRVATLDVEPWRGHRGGWPNGREQNNRTHYLG